MIIPLDKLLTLNTNKYIFTKGVMKAVDLVGNIKNYPETDLNWKVVPNVLKLALDGEVTLVYNHEGEIMRNIQADIIDHQSYLEFLDKGTVLFFGNGAKKCREIISHPNAIFIENVITSASHMAPVSQRYFNLSKFADVAYYEPYYLKDFVATIPVKNIF